MATSRGPMTLTERIDGAGRRAARVRLQGLMTGLALIALPLEATTAQVDLREATGLAVVEDLGPSVTSGFGDFDGDYLQEGLFHYQTSVRPIEFGPEPDAWSSHHVNTANTPGGGWLHVRTGEVHGDGHADVLRWYPGGLSILSGAEGLAEHHWVGAAQIPAPDDVLVVDLDGDGLTDAAEVLVAGQVTDVHVLAADGSGSFFSSQSFSLPSTGAVRELLSADLDADGVPDLLASRKATGDVDLAWGTGDTTFSGAHLIATTPGAAWHFASDTSDLDRDGDLDLLQIHLAAGTTDQHVLATHHNDGQGGVILQGTESLPGPYAYLTTADLDGDGFGELLFHGEPPTNSSSDVLVRSLTGTGATLAERSVPIFAGPSLYVADVDCDGLDDIVSMSFGRAYVAIQSQGLEFAGGQSALLGPAPQAGTRLASADMDGDGSTDVVALDGEAPSLKVMLGDGAAGFTQVEENTPKPGSLAIALGDVDADGLVDAVMGAGGGGLTGGEWGSIDLAKGLGGGDLGTLVSVAVIDRAESVKLGDLDGDGDLDCVSSGTNIMLFEAGAFLPPNRYGDGFGVGLGDFDGDGDLDVFSGKGDLGLGDGLGGLLAWIVTSGFVSNDVTVGDLEPDGDLDAVGVWDSPDGDTFLYIATNDGLGGMTISQGPMIPDGTQSGSFPTTAAPVALVDVDGDGGLDLLAPTTWLYLLRGDGQGGFAQPGIVGIDADSTIVTADVDGDSFPDLSFHRRDRLRAITLRTPSLKPMTDLGAAKTGTFGLPILKAFGTLLPDSDLRISLCNARALATSHLVWGLAAIHAPFKGGTMVPLPSAVLMGIPVDPDGSMVGTFHWPGGAPAGFELYMQVWIEDPDAWQGISASNGLRIITP